MDNMKDFNKKKEELALDKNLAKKQHDKGKLTAEERIKLLVDEGSFTEIDEFVELRSTNFNLQDIEFTGGDKTTRNNYSMGLSYRDSKLGILSIRYDHIIYGTSVDYNDSIFNAKYQYNF